jgi:hypothetical protein
MGVPVLSKELIVKNVPAAVKRSEAGHNSLKIP